MAKRKKNPGVHPEVERLLERARRLGSSASAPRKHHLVPKSYLARWEEDGLIRVTDVEAGKDFKTSPATAARETDFYNVGSKDLDPDELPPLLFELLLSEVEGWGVKGIDHLIEMPARPDPEIAAKFAWFLAMTLTRGRSTRTRLRTFSEEIARLQHKDVTRAGIISMMLDAGIEPTETAVESAVTFVDEIRDGSIVLSPQDAALVGVAAQSSYALGEELLKRAWTLFETPRVLVTCDEPVIVIGGPGHRRDERAGLASAGAVVFPLTPGVALVMFHSDRAARLGVPYGGLQIGELDHGDVIELNREIAMNCHRWIFERPSKRVGANLKVPALPGKAVVEDRPDLQATDAPENDVIRIYAQSRWGLTAPWPIAAWWI